jgi:HNH endonuclease/NUMOD4 motif
MSEEWRIIPSFPDYEASSLGRVRRRTSMQSALGKFHTHSGKILKAIVNNKTGYWRLTPIGPDGRRRDVNVHRLICEAFHGPCPPGMQCAHNDGSRTNNASDNLRWTTPSENQFDRIDHGTALAGTQIANSKLNPSAVIAIRRRRENGERCIDIAKDFGVSQYAISKVCLRKNWSHI